MRISIVTISFNQVEYLEETILSVLNQSHSDFEYIVVDPGSIDGSREIIERYRDKISKIIFERDIGAADGLNNGFKYATGDILCYLNSDDTFLPNAFDIISKYFTNHKYIDVVSGHGHIIDQNSVFKRKVFSDKFSLESSAYGSSIAIQPSTFFRKDIFFKSGGFNVANFSNWDGELLIDMALVGAKIGLIDEFLSCYRVHGTSITGTGKLAHAHQIHSINMFQKVKNRNFRKIDLLIGIFYRIRKHFLNPRATFERIKYGPVFGTKK